MVNGAGADKVMTALISGDVDRFYGVRSQYLRKPGRCCDPAVNFAQLTQRAGNFLVGRTKQPEFKWED